MNRIVPLLPPVAVLLLIVTSALDPMKRGGREPATFLAAIPLIVIVAAYYWVGRRSKTANGLASPPDSGETTG